MVVDGDGACAGEKQLRGFEVDLAIEEEDACAEALWGDSIGDGDETRDEAFVDLGAELEGESE